MFSKVLNIGIHHSLDFYQKRELKVLNALALIVILGLLIGSTNVLFLGDLYPALSELLIAISTLFVVFFNWKKMYELAAYLFVFIINATIFFVSQYYDKSVDCYLYYFPVIICVALLHNPNKPKIRSFIFFGMILLSFLLSRQLNVQFLSGKTFTAEQNHLLLLYNVYFCITLTIALIYVFIRMLEKQYSELNELVTKTKKDQIIISNSLREKELLLSEIQHRVKNNLAVIIALFNFQKDASTNEETKTSLIEAKNRVLSIAMVHEQLYKKDDLSKINLEQYISELIREILRSHPVYSDVNVIKHINPVILDITKTVPLGLIVNEIITNSLKHGFTNSKNLTPEITVYLNQSEQTITLKINDNGSGFPLPIEKNPNSLGLSLMESLASQIDGTILFSNNNGAQVQLSFLA